MLASVSLPVFQADVSGSVAPRQVFFDSFLLIFVRLEIRVVQSELAESREMALDAIQPRCVRGGEVEPDAVLGRPFPDFGLAMVTHIVQYDIEHTTIAVATTKPA